MGFMFKNIAIGCQLKKTQGKNVINIQIYSLSMCSCILNMFKLKSLDAVWVWFTPKEQCRISVSEKEKSWIGIKKLVNVHLCVSD